VPTIHDVSEYVAWNVRSPDFFIKDLLPRGGSLLLYGQPGVMKSWLSQHMGYCIATGTEWLGFPTFQGRTLVVNFEISAPSYHGRLRLMSRRFELEPQTLYEYSPSLLYLENDRVFHGFQEKIDEISPDVIILDCLSGCFGGDENSSREMSELILHLTELKRETRAIIVVHHSNKNILATNPMDRSRGHTKLTGWVDSILYMVNQPAGKQVQFGKTRHSTRVLHSLNIRFDNYSWELRTGAGRTQEEE